MQVVSEIGEKVKVLNNAKTLLEITLRKKATIHQVTIMLATSKNVLFPGHKHLLTIGADDTLIIAWSSGGYDLEIGHF